MLYKYSVILDINPSEYEEVKQDLDCRTLKYARKFSSLQEMSIKEQLKFYIEKNNIKDRDRMFELIDKLQTLFLFNFSAKEEIMLTLNYYNTKLDSIVVPSGNIEESIIENAIMLYGNDFYVLTEINELEYKLNSYIKCNVCI